MSTQKGGLQVLKKSSSKVLTQYLFKAYNMWLWHLLEHWYDATWSFQIKNTM
jgi:hypothetical protein